MPLQEQETIVAAALSWNGEVLTLPKPARHNDIMSAFRDKVSYDTIRPSNYGFVTSSGRFVDRRRAAFIAMCAEQITQCKHGNELYTDDIW